MAPPKRERVEVLEINSITPNLNSNISQKIRIKPLFRTKDLDEIRKNAFHFVVHTLAMLIIATYLILIIFRGNAPIEYSTMVSIVIGFYFSRALFRD